MQLSRRIFRWSLAAVAFAAGRLAAEKPAYKVFMEHASPPFSSRNAQGQPTGFAVDLMRAVAEDQGLRIEFELKPWQEIYADFQQGHGDILGLVATSEERAAFMDFSLPFERLVCGLYYQRDHSSINSLAALRGKRLAVIADAITHEFAKRQDWGVVIQPYSSLGECLQSVERGESDALLGMQLVTDYEMQRLGLTHVVRSELDFPEITYQLCFAVQPGQKRLLARINQGLYNVRLNRRQDTLHEKWIGPLEPQRLRWRDVQPYLPVATLVAIATLGIFVWQRRLLRRLSRQAEEIRGNEERLQLVFEGSQDGFWDWNVVTHRVMRSPRWAGMLGYTLEEIGPEREAFHRLIHADDLKVIAGDEKFLWGGRDQFAHEFRMRAKSGEWKWILDRGKVVARDPATQAPLRITGTHTDITARKVAEAEADKLQQKMLETQKLESLGVLAGGIAHDFNNLLTVILGNITLARLESTESPGNRARLDSVITSAHRAAELCHQLLAYAGKGSYALERVNLNDIVTETTRLLELSISKQAKLEFALAPSLPRIEVDPAQIRQIIMNLVINASEALAPKPGVIRISTAAVVLPLTGESAPVAEAAPGNYVCLRIADTGCGMKPEVLARIFDPFFTTKFTGRGLGLAAVIGIVRTHHGTLKVESRSDEGSVFSIYLPVSQTQTAHPFTVIASRP
ncbi:MAG: domain S-box-containing protein [Lacunisphaera sp.]|nr:domain S-box-containing protein [Lacunisphaera sp.]